MNSDQESSANGIALVCVCLIMGSILPWVFTNKIVVFISIIIITFGIGGMGFEMEKLRSKIGYSDFFMGMGMLFWGASGLFLINSVFFKIIFLLSITFGIFGFISGIVKLLFQRKIISNGEKSDKDILVNIKLSIGFVVTAISFISDLISVITYFQHAI